MPHMSNLPWTTMYLMTLMILMIIITKNSWTWMKMSANKSTQNMNPRHWKW